PKVVLIEGLADADSLIPHIAKKGTKPPIAILAYTDAVPVRTLVYPLARYSPEFQAMAWAQENDVRVECIDLPSDIFLGLQDLEIGRLERKKDEEQEGEEDEADEPVAQDIGKPERARSIYERLAERGGEPDYDTYWERRFEHNLAEDSYRLASF